MKTPKKIALILRSYQGGGAEKMMIRLGNGFADKGYDVSLILLKPVGPYKHLVQANINIIHSPETPFLYFKIPWLIIMLLKIRPHKILSTLTQVNCLTVLAALPLLMRKKVIIREAHMHLSRRDLHTNWKKRMLLKASKLIYPLAGSYVAVSKDVKCDLLKFYRLKKENIHVCYNPVVTKSFTDSLDEKNSVKCYYSNTVNILSVANLKPVKGHHDLIRAFREVDLKMDAKLYLIGKVINQSYYYELKKLIREYNIESKVSFLGFKENPSRYMAEADVLVLNSTSEGFGNVLIEAMTAGCPVVSTDCPGGSREILQDGEFGKLVPVNNHKKLAAAIINTVKNKPIKKNLKERGNYFNLDNSTRCYIHNVIDG